MLLSEAKRILLNAGYRLDEGKNGPSLARVIKDWIKNNTEYTALIKDMGVTKGETSSGEKNKTYKIVLKKTPIIFKSIKIRTSLIIHANTKNSKPLTSFSDWVFWINFL